MDCLIINTLNQLFYIINFLIFIYMTKDSTFKYFNDEWNGKKDKEDEPYFSRMGTSIDYADPGKEQKEIQQKK